MTRRPDTAPFAVRLARAYQLLAAGVAPAPVHLADQLDAAGKEKFGIAERMGDLLPIFEPGRPWYHRTDASPSVHTRALLIAALLGCLGSVCCHLRRGGPQPAIARLPLRRVDCTRCVGTFRRPPPDDADRCDVCEQHGVVIFSPFTVHQGPVLLIGDACQTCAAVLGIRIAEEAS
jgi:hypothetical protein